MKGKLILVILFIVFALGCIQKQKSSNSIDVSQTLGFAKIKAPVKSQLKKSFVSESKFCYSQLDLFEDSTFFKRTVCEASAHFSLGKWRINKDSLILSYTPLNKFNMIVDYSLKGDTSKFVVLKIINQNHEPIEKLELIGFKKGIPAKTALKYGLLLTDKKGEIKIKKADFDSLSISGFKNITNKILTLKNSILPDSMKLTLFFNSTNFCQFPTFDYYKDSSVYFIKKGKLIADDVDYIMQSPF